MTRLTPYHFFLKHAGYSYDPKTQTKMQGRIMGAKELAAAERWALDQGCSFDWEVDDVDSSDWSDERSSWNQWVCIMRDAHGNVMESLCGIDFGRDGEPWGEPYKRVVEAELASDAMHDAENQAFKATVAESAGL